MYIPCNSNYLLLCEETPSEGHMAGLLCVPAKCHHYFSDIAYKLLFSLPSPPPLFFLPKTNTPVISSSLESLLSYTHPEYNLHVCFLSVRFVSEVLGLSSWQIMGTQTNQIDKQLACLFLDPLLCLDMTNSL